MSATYPHTCPYCLTPTSRPGPCMAHHQPRRIRRQHAMRDFRLRFTSHSGMSYDMGTFSDRKDAFSRARQRITAFRHWYPCCTVSRIGPREWEFTDCGAHLISDLHGFLRIYRVLETP